MCCIHLVNCRCSQCGCGVGDGGCIHCGLCQICCTPREDGAPSAVVLLPSPASGQADAPPSAAAATAGQVTAPIVSGPPAQAAAPFVATASCEQNQRLAAAVSRGLVLAPSVPYHHPKVIMEID